MSKVIIMGMIFESGSEPDFGSIYRCCERQNGVHDYGLNVADVEKLDLITNAAPGSTALCDDTADIYRLTKTGEWQKFGEDATRSVQSAPTVVSLSLGKSVSEPENNFDFDEFSFEEKEEPSEEKESLEIKEKEPSKEVF